MPTDGPDPILTEIADLCAEGVSVVLVHGGGPDIDRALAARGIVTERVEGLRVTDSATLEVTEATLSGSVNKRLVRACMALGIRAAGISGEDGALLVAERIGTTSGADLGYVGRVIGVEPRLITTLLEAGFLPVVAPLAVSADGKTAYNINADLAAGAIAGALRADAFVAITDVPRILRDPTDPSSGIDRLSIRDGMEFADSAACQGSMKPKLQAAVAAVAGGAAISLVCGAMPGAIRAAMSGNATIVQ